MPQPHLRKCRSGCLIVRLRKIRRVILIQGLLADQIILSATAAHESVRPVRMEVGVDLAIVAGDSTQVKNHTQEKHETQAEEECNCTFKGFCLLRMLQYPAKACDTPKDTKEDCESPTK